MSAFCRWLPKCAALFDAYKDLWLPLIPDDEQMAPVAVQEFFSCVASLMSLQLRSLVVDSLQDILYVFTLHQVLRLISLFCLLFFFVFPARSALFSSSLVLILLTCCCSLARSAAWQRLWQGV